MTSVEVAERVFFNRKPRGAAPLPPLADENKSTRSRRKKQERKRHSDIQNPYPFPSVPISNGSTISRHSNSLGSLTERTEHRSRGFQVNHKGSRLYQSQPVLSGKRRKLANAQNGMGQSVAEESKPSPFVSLSNSMNDVSKLQQSTSGSNLCLLQMDDDTDSDYDSDDLRPSQNPTISLDAREKAAEKAVNQNWLLKTQNQKEKRKKQRQAAKLRIAIPDEDPMSSIEKRMEEIKMMTKPRRDTTHVLDRIHPDQKHRILKIHEIPMQQFLKERRRNRKPRERFRCLCKLILLVTKCFSRRKKYFSDRNDMSEMKRHLPKEIDKHGPTITLKSSLGEDLQRCLIMQPQYRDSKMIKRILWLLRATRAFKHLFPAEMESELAKRLAYEKYDDGRIIACQARKPDRFYYVISGRVRVLRQFPITSGQVTKFMGYLMKGQYTDSEEMEKQWLREDSLVAKGNVEMLILDLKDYQFLSHTTAGPPLEFLRNLDLFEEFPVDEFTNHKDSIEYRYYGQGKVVVRDSNRTPWLHIIKSGQVKVVRRQAVIDSLSSNEGKFQSPTANGLGNGRIFSHAKTMLGLLNSQKSNKSNSELSLPQIVLTSGGMVTNPLGNTIDARVELVNSDAEPTGLSQSPLIYRNRQNRLKKSEDSEEVVHSHQDVRLGSPRRYLTSQLSEADETDAAETASPRVAALPTQSVAGLPPILNIPMRQNSGEFQFHPLWLTREKTTFDPGHAQTEGRSKDIPHRKTYIQLDILNPGDVFGLDHMQPPIASETRGVSLLSDGAEVIRISKRFFLQHAANNTMLKLDILYKEYITEEEAKDLLYSRETWQQYREALWQRLTAKIPIPQPSGSSR